MSRVIDLKSDTVTKPTEEMREAMAQAEVGDDYYFEDPTVLKLQELSAEKLGKEAGLFVTSGTMGNLVSILTHTQRGDSIILEADAHIYHNETGHLSVVEGVLPIRVKGHLGMLDPVDIESAVFEERVIHPRTSLVCVENTHNTAGGTCISAEQMRSIKEVADRFGLAIHVDGARIFNAAIALETDAIELAKDADSLTFCLSKGLGCPFGSVIVGSKEFIKEARKNRQMVGGGMRQAGIMAAAGVVALEKMIDRLKEDHENARTLAEGLVELGMEVEMETVQTNIVYFRVPSSMIDAQEFVVKLKEHDVIVNPPRKGRIRMVTHYGITRDDILHALKALSTILKQRAS